MSKQRTNDERIEQLERAVRYIALRHTTDGEHFDVLWKVRTLLHTPEEKKPPEEKVPPKSTSHHEWYVSEFPYHRNLLAVVERESAQSWHESRRQAIKDVADWLMFRGQCGVADLVNEHDWGTSGGE